MGQRDGEIDGHAVRREVNRFAQLWDFYNSLNKTEKAAAIFVGLSAFAGGAVAISDFFILLRSWAITLFHLFFG